MLYNTKALLLHCVFHGIRFKVNEDWVSVIDTLLFFMKVAGCGLRFSAATPRRNRGCVKMKKDYHNVVSF